MASISHAAMPPGQRAFSRRGPFSNTIFINEHASNLFHVKCRIPEEKEALLAYIRKFADGSDKKDLRRYREMITRAF
ncbi:MAG: hypothetical protein IJK04_11185 [Kiritimatiellae bacterium]|nr:hypothetical protein [Kiritimatiellia bacterium]